MQFGTLVVLLLCVAEPYKMYIYQEGDFFKFHVDSKKGEDHVMTLVLDVFGGECEGGEVVFRDAERDMDLEEQQELAEDEDQIGMSCKNKQDEDENIGETW